MNSLRQSGVIFRQRIGRRALRFEPLEERSLLSVGAGPTVLRSSPDLQSGLVAKNISSLLLDFSTKVVGGTAAGNYELRCAGTDAVFDTDDDQLIAVAASESKVSVVGNGDNYDILLDFAPLAIGRYRLTLSDAITDFAGLALDGDADGVAGGDWSREFQVIRTTSSMFARPVLFNAGGGTPYHIEPGDFNGDGRIDLAVTNYDGGLGILWNNGTGGFSAPTVLSTGGTRPSESTAADFNGDGLLDLAVTNNASSAISILLNNGDKSFAPPLLLGTTSDPYNITSGDFDGDGTIDLAASSYNGACVEIFWGDGHGAFSSTSTYGTGGHWVNGVATADFDGDGDLDLVVTSYGGARLLLNNGDHTFSAGALLNSGVSSWDALVADFNKDGKPDLALCTNNSTVGVFLNQGDGTFGGMKAYATSKIRLNRIAVADIDGNGTMDIIAAVHYGTTVEVLSGNGRGGFLSSGMLNCGSILGGTESFDVVAADFDHNGYPDLAIANTNSTTITVLRNTIVPPVNSQAAVTIANISSPRAQDVTITYMLADAESDSCDITVEYSPDAGEHWYPATSRYIGEGTSNLASSPYGTSHTFVWDSSVIGSSKNDSVKIRISASDLGDANTDTSACFAVNNNQLPWTRIDVSQGTQSGIITVPYTLFDTEGDLCSIQVEYSPETGSAWHPAILVDGDGTTNLTSSNVGTPHSFVWDSSVLGANRLAHVMFRITPTDSEPGTAGTSIRFAVDNLERFDLLENDQRAFMAGQNVPIHWNASGAVPGSLISLCYDRDTEFNGNEKWIEIDRVSAVNGSGSYQWNTAGVAPGRYYLAGYMFDGQEAFSTSHLTQPIVIESAVKPEFHLAVSGGHNLHGNQGLSIQWTTTNASADSSISLCYDEDTVWWNGNEHWIEIDAIAAAQGSGTYSWKADGVPAGKFYIAGYLWSDGRPIFYHLTEPVTIENTRPTFELTGPVANKAAIGTPLSITWTAGGVPTGSTVSLCYDEDTVWWNGNEHWIEIDRVTAQNGSASYSWDTSGTRAGTYYVGGYLWANGKPVFSRMSQPVTLEGSSPEFTLTPPLQTSCTVGDYVSVSWKASHLVGGSTVSLCYDADQVWWNGNEHWIEIDRVRPSEGSGGYGWDTTGVAPGTYYLAGYLWSGGKPTFSRVNQPVQIKAAPPVFELTTPALEESCQAGQSVGISWITRNLSKKGAISLYYVEAGVPNAEKHWIEIDQIQVANGAASYLWNTAGVKPGTYKIGGYLYCDGEAIYSSIPGMGLVTIQEASVIITTCQGADVLHLGLEGLT